MYFLRGGEALLVPVILLVLAGVIIVVLITVPQRRVRVEHRRLEVQQDGAVGRVADRLSRVVGALLSRGNRTGQWAAALDRAGVKLDLSHFIIVAGAAALAGLAVGMLLGSPLVGVLLAALAVAAMIVSVNFRASRRRDDFADQLDDLLQLLAGNMRAGHSLLQSFDSLTQELDEPSATEIARVVNQTRVGRDLGEALHELGDRMDSDDFRWVAQAVTIHRQVGGNLADVLDSVGRTIRERNQIRRQVKALSAEGRLSGLVLMALPVFMVFVLLILNPDYIGLLVSSPLGFVLIGAGLLMLSIGGLWLRKVIEVKF